MSDPKFTGAAFADAVLFVACACCGQEAGDECRMPSGRVANTPHVERTAALHEKYGYEPWIRK